MLVVLFTGYAVAYACIGAAAGLVAIFTMIKGAEVTDPEKCEQCNEYFINCECFKRWKH